MYGRTRKKGRKVRIIKEDKTNRCGIVNVIR
jgi:hypothetical protein